MLIDETIAETNYAQVKLAGVIMPYGRAIRGEKITVIIPPPGT